MTRRGPVDDRPTARLLQLIAGWRSSGATSVSLDLLLQIVQREEDRAEYYDNYRLQYTSPKYIGLDSASGYISEATMSLFGWVGFAKQILPVALLLVPGGAALAPLLPTIVATMTAVETIPGKTGPEKKALTVAATMSGLETYNAIQAQHGGSVINPVVVASALDKGIDAGVAAVNAFHTAVLTPPTTPAAASPTDAVGSTDQTSSR